MRLALQPPNVDDYARQPERTNSGSAGPSDTGVGPLASTGPSVGLERAIARCVPSLADCFGAKKSRSVSQ